MISRKVVLYRFADGYVHNVGDGDGERKATAQPRFVSIALSAEIRGRLTPNAQGKLEWM